MSVLIWACSQIPAWSCDQNTCAAAASGGHVAILQWLRAQDPPAPWDTGACAYTAQNGHLNVLQWLRDSRAICVMPDCDGMYIDILEIRIL
jgi:hypothetical protein